MKHYFKCTNCRSENKVKIYENDRGEYQMKKGEFANVTCDFCHLKTKIHINKIYASVNNLPIYIVAGVSFVIALVLLIISDKIIIITSVGTAAPILTYGNEKSNVNTFNRYKIKE
jgi:hypothetical protein